MRARARGLFAGMLPVTVAMAAIAGAPPARAAGSLGTISTVAGGPGRGLAHNAGSLGTISTVAGGPGHGPAHNAGSPGTISTVAGGPGRGLVHNVAQEANWVATAPDGSVYETDVQGVVRQFNDTSTWEKAIAGVGVATGYGGDGGLATRARLSFPEAVAVDGAGNLLISDTNNERVRLVAATSGIFYGQAMTAGDIYTVAGSGRFEFSGDGGPATAAGLRDPQGVTVDPSGNLVIADSFDSRVRVVAATSGTFYGAAMTAGDI